MRAVIQRISHGEVRVKGETVGEINQGLCVMLGVLVTDGEAQCDHLAEKISNLRIFEDDNQKMNRSVKDIQGGVLAISNFTLCTENKKSGNRPSFILAARPEQAEPLYRRFCEKLKEFGVEKTARGIFGADMEVSIQADGPVTIWMDTDTNC
ncbi:MAG: D-tyrosyl-tRNA(Tyr) deacylase [Oscillospiraceae bacterium]|jgi:D-tyrosyl-tRNA(Tyr) deacylase|nr:D-tyrosyl-tRNA(Tyr) deacylase [Oscillospiraceae bacterium]